MRRRWTESGVHPVRWWRLHWPKRPRRCSWSSARGWTRCRDSSAIWLSFPRWHRCDFRSTNRLRPSGWSRMKRSATACACSRRCLARNRPKSSSRAFRPSCSPCRAGRDWPNRHGPCGSAIRFRSRKFPPGWFATAFRIRRPSSCRANSPIAAASSTSLPPTGSTPCGLNCSATRSNRSGSSRRPASGACRELRLSMSRQSPAGRHRLPPVQTTTRTCRPAVTATAPSPRTPRQASRHLADYLPPRSWFLLMEPGDLESEGRQYLERLDRPQDSIAWPT